MLTNCKDCQYFRGDGGSGSSCLPNPSYCEGFMFFDQKKSGMSQTQKDAMNAIAKPCEKFCKSDQLEVRSQLVALTLRTWAEIVQHLEEIINSKDDGWEQWVPLLESAKKAIKNS